MYLSWNEKTITDFSAENVEAMYEQGYVFTRIGKGVMHQTRSARIDLSKFELSSENRRILKKVESLELIVHSIPYQKYEPQIGKIAKNFYDARQADFSANKAKELITEQSFTNHNRFLEFRTGDTHRGYCIAFETNILFHYCYPFYDFESKDFGLGMMLKAILWAKKNAKRYFYLGSLQRPNDTYKLQFSGLEWFDGKEWQTDSAKAKKVLIQS